MDDTHFKNPDRGITNGNQIFKNTVNFLTEMIIGKKPLD